MSVSGQMSNNYINLTAYFNVYNDDNDDVLMTIHHYYYDH